MNPKREREHIFPLTIDGLTNQLQAGESRRVMVKFVVPAEPGSNRMCIAANWDN